MQLTPIHQPLSEAATRGHAGGDADGTAARWLFLQSPFRGASSGYCYDLLDLLTNSMLATASTEDLSAEFGLSPAHCREMRRLRRDLIALWSDRAELRMGLAKGIALVASLLDDSGDGLADELAAYHADRRQRAELAAEVAA